MSHYIAEKKKHVNRCCTLVIIVNYYYCYNYHPLLYRHNYYYIIITLSLIIVIIAITLSSSSSSSLPSSRRCGHHFKALRILLINVTFIVNGSRPSLIAHMRIKSCILIYFADWIISTSFSYYKRNYPSVLHTYPSTILSE